VIREVRIAVQFLTRIPVGTPAYREGDLRAATGAFPLVGLFVAAIVIGVRWLAGLALPDVAATVLAIAAGALATGAFHEDGLADTFDGLWGGATAEDRLAIMRDSRLGTYGTFALVVAFALRLALLAPLELGAFAAAVAVGAVLGRASSLPLLRWMPAATGSSAALAGAPTNASLVVAAVTVAVTLAVATGSWGWLPLVVAAIVTRVCAGVIRTKLGGITGDVLGATNQLVELGAIASVVTLAARDLLG